MPIISFWSNSKKETGKTLASIAISTMIAIDHNYKTLLISTDFDDKTAFESFFTETQNSGLQKRLGLRNDSLNSENGVEGLSRIVESNRIRPGLIQDYAKVVFRERFDVLTSPVAENIEDYYDIAKNYPQILEVAKRDYNLTFVDVSRKLPDDVKERILEMSDVIVLNTTQGLHSLNSVEELREKDERFRSSKTMILIGRYDKFSKYNEKNISRYLREKKEIIAIPYNTLFFEATTEGQVPDYLLKYKTLSDKNDRNYVFIQETKKACDEILYRIQELRMHNRL